MKKFMVISGSYGLGAGIRHPSRGPQVLRDMGLIERLQSIGCEVLDGGDELEPSAASGPGPDPKLRYLDQLLDFSSRFGKRIDSAWDGGYTPIILGGDHSISITSVSHASRAINSSMERVPNLAYSGLMHMAISTPPKLLLVATFMACQLRLCSDMEIHAYALLQAQALSYVQRI